jgi:hypothetical protein
MLAAVTLGAFVVASCYFIGGKSFLITCGVISAILIFFYKKTQQQSVATPSAFMKTDLALCTFRKNIDILIPFRADIVEDIKTHMVQFFQLYINCFSQYNFQEFTLLLDEKNAIITLCGEFQFDGIEGGDDLAENFRSISDKYITVLVVKNDIVYDYPIPM